MQRLLICLSLLVLAGSAQAGVYNLAEWRPFLNHAQARGYYLDIRSASIPLDPKKPPKPFQAEVLKQVEHLEQLKADGLLSTIDRVNLSGCYLRLGGQRIGDARRLLLAGDQKDFLIQSNLAAAYFLSGELEMATRHQQNALTFWPDVFAGWTGQQLKQYRNAERALLTLYLLRREEARRGPTRGEVDVDALFPRVRFVGPSGQYEAGALSQANQDLLPDNAFALVFQLLTWFPTDMRLYWLFGEMLNAAGSVDQASMVFVELVEAGMARSFKDLAKHRRVLLDAKPVFVKFHDLEFQGALLGELLMLSRPPLAPPIIGDVAYLAGASGNALFVRRIAELKEREGLPQQDQKPFTTPPTSTAQVFTFRHIAIGFGSGFVIAMLCALQVQELRRRRFQAALARDDRDPVPIRSPGESTSITPGG